MKATASKSTGQRRCQATNKRGQQCQTAALHGSKFCYTHDPDNAERRAESRRKGGHARHGQRSNVDKTAVEIKTPADVLALMGRAINDVLALDNSIARAKAIAALGSVALRVMQTDDLEQRIAALELRLQLVGQSSIRKVA